MVKEDFKPYMKDYTTIERIEANENWVILTKKRFWIVYSEIHSIDNLIDWINKPLYLWIY
jgi:hypothetical protein